MVSRRSDQRAPHKWTFRSRFRRNAFGWRSQPAIQRVKQAVSEIKKVARTDPVLGAAGAVLLLEKVSAALAQVDSSSGAIGTAVNRAVAELAAVIARAPADPPTRDRWLQRLWQAYERDDIPYIEGLGDHWGKLCAAPAVASRWADQLLDQVREAWSSGRGGSGYSQATAPCLSALLAAERHDEILDLLERAPLRMWHERHYGVKALVAMGRKAEALRYAEASAGLNDDPVAIARACEEILLSSGLADEAYARYGLEANRAGTNLAWFRALVRKFPYKGPDAMLADLVQMTPGQEGKWFAAAKHAALYDEALALARRSPCDPGTLTRAARDFAERRPGFAVEAGLLALHWLVEGYGYEITNLDVLAAYTHTMQAAEQLGTADETRQRIRQTVAQEADTDRFVGRSLERVLREG